MAFVLTYSTLTSTIQSYLERTDPRLIANIPVFILLGQRRVTRDLKILNIKNFVTDNLTIGQSIIEKPGDWISTNYLDIGTGVGFNTKVILELRSFEYCNTYWPDQTQTGQPLYFCDYTFNSHRIFPTPDQNYPYQLGYYALPPLLDETVGVNIITTTIPDVLLYACLLETASFLKDDERLPIWTDYYTKSRDAVYQEDLSRIQVGFNMNVH
jgi:hypothetical protein